MNSLVSIPEVFFDDELRSGYLVKGDIKKLWAVQLDLLFKFNLVCEQLGITYYACAGTLLGAIRHNGYIPWDDDLDVMVFRNDYNRLCQAAEKGVFEPPYFWQTEYTDPGTLRGHAQLRNSSTTGIINSELKGGYSFNQGIFIDIFPIDNVPNKTEERKNFLTELDSEKSRLMRYANFTYWFSGNTSSGIKKIAKSFVHMPLMLLENKYGILKKRYAKYEMKMQQYNSYDTSFVGITALSQYMDRFIWDKSLFDGEPQKVKFEMLSIPVPSGYLSILEKSYGDWKKPVKGASVHGSICFDTSKSYKTYIADCKR